MAPPTKSNKLGGGGGGGGGGGVGEEFETPSNNLWVGNLATDVTDADLMDLFVQYGALDSVTSYSSRSYAFVFFKRMEDAKAAKDALQGTLFRGNPIKIEFARPVRSDLWVSLGFLCCCYSCSNRSGILNSDEFVIDFLNLFFNFNFNFSFLIL